MGILIMLKEGGSLGIDTIVNKPIDEDIDLLPDVGGTLEFYWRTITSSIPVTSTTSTKPRAIVMGV